MRKLYQRNIGKILISCAIFVFAFFVGMGISLAAEPSITLVSLFTILRQILIPVGMIIGTGLIILNGYKFMTSQGDPRKVQDSKDGLTSAIMGIVFVALSTFILSFIIKGLLGQ